MFLPKKDKNMAQRYVECPVCAMGRERVVRTEPLKDDFILK
jgi:hypothetical protein